MYQAAMVGLKTMIDDQILCILSQQIFELFDDVQVLNAP